MGLPGLAVNSAHADVGRERDGEIEVRGERDHGQVVQGENGDCDENGINDPSGRVLCHGDLLLLSIVGNATPAFGMLI